MNPFQFKVTCSVCGGDGMGTLATAAAGWDARQEVRHKDPRVCAENLREERRRLEKMRVEAKRGGQDG